MINTNGTAQISKDGHPDRSSRPLVSVILPTYNASAFVENAIHSVRNQEIDFELIIIDDASTDDTVSHIKELIKDDGRAKIFELPHNAGPSVARNFGIERARGRWTAILDADDRYARDRLAFAISLAEKEAADVICDNFRYYNVQKDEISPPALQSGDDSTLSFYHFINGARPYRDESDLGLLKPVFRTQFLLNKNVRYNPLIRHGEDFLLMVDLFLDGAKVILTRAPGYIYTDRASSFSKTKIDYPSMWRQSNILMRDPRISSSPPLKKAFRRRVNALKRLSNERNLRLAREQERNIRAVIYGVLDVFYRRRLVYLIKRRLRRN